MKPMKGYNKTLPLEEVKLPAYFSYKLDGIRAYTKDGKFFSNSNKLIPNKELQEKAKDLPEGWDGELYCHGLEYNEINSIVMSQSHPNTDAISFYVFDVWNTDLAFEDRLQVLHEYETDYYGNIFVEFVHHFYVSLRRDIDFQWDKAVSKGFEGLMSRAAHLKYKYGRSGKTDQHLLKFKKWYDDEAIVIGFEEGQHNENEAFIGELGQTKRSRESAGMVPSGSLGALIVQWHGHNFKIGGGPGLTLALRQEIWNNQERYLSQRVTFKYLNLSKYGVPRHPGFKGFRYD